MNSKDSKRIISEIAAEEGLSEWAVELIVKSQFEGVAMTFRSSTPDDPGSFKGVRLNAFGHFRVIKSRFGKFKGRSKYEQIKRQRYDNGKRKSEQLFSGSDREDNDKS